MIDSPIDHVPVAAPAGLIGHTPLVRLEAFETRPGVEIYAKLESRNPGGSVKDRAAWSMVRAGERAGALGPGKVLLDATSGNTGISYAMLGAARGFKVRLCVPANVTVERKRGAKWSVARRVKVAVKRNGRFTKDIPRLPVGSYRVSGFFEGTGTSKPARSGYSTF